CRLRGTGALVAADQDFDFRADLRCGGDGVEDGRLERGVVVFSNDEDGHGAQITLASFFSFSTSSGTLFTILPALRLGGFCTFSVFSRGAGSTARPSGVRVSSG